MHEASVCQGLLKMVLEAVKNYNEANPQQPVVAVKKIICGAGLLAGFENQTLKACFEMFAEGTLAEKARVEIETEPLRCHCQSCGQDFELRQRHFVCPFCLGDQLKFSGGHGLVLKAVNVESKELPNG